jgi:hypothetical protein
VYAINKTGMWAVACLSFALTCETASAEKRMMTNSAFGCPSAHETSRVLQMRREGLGVDGHVTEEVDRASRVYMSEHKCRFLKKGDLVEFEWSNLQKLEPESMGQAVCIHLPNTDECAYTPKNFAESRSSAVQEEVAKSPVQDAGPAPRSTAENHATPPQSPTSSPATGMPSSSLPAPTRPRPRTPDRIEISPL